MLRLRPQALTLCWITIAAVTAAVVSPASAYVVVAEDDQFSWPRSVELIGGLAYVAGLNGSSEIYDISNPDHPVRIGSMVGTGTDIAIADGYAYLAGSSGALRVVDVSNPMAPETLPPVDHLPPGSGSPSAVAVADGRAYTIGRSTVPGNAWHLRVFDLATPASPVEIGHVRTSGSDIEVKDGLVYVVDAYLSGPAALLIVDLGDPDDLAVVGSWNPPDRQTGAADLLLDGTRAYLARSDRVFVLDVSDPREPVLLGEVPDRASRIAVAGDILYLAQPYGFAAWNLADLAHPQRVGTLRLPFPVRGIAIRDDRAFLANDQAGFRVVDLSEPGWPRVAETIAQAGFPNARTSISGTLALLAGDEALQVVDISDPDAPQQIGTPVSVTPASVGSVPLDAVAAGDHAYVVGDDFTVVDLADPASPQLGAALDLVCGASPCSALDHVEVRGDRAYVLDASWLSIVDVSNPQSPVTLGSVNLHLPIFNWSNGFDVVGTTVWIAVNGSDPVMRYYRQLLEIDASDPTHPVLGRRFDLSFTRAPNAVVIQGDLAYVAAGGLDIYSLSDLESGAQFPTPLGTVSFPESADDVAVADGIAYVSSNGVFAIDVSDPAHPFLLGGAGAVGEDLELAGGRIFGVTRGVDTASFQVIDFGPEYLAAPEPARTCTALAAFAALAVLGRRSHAAH